MKKSRYLGITLALMGFLLLTGCFRALQPDAGVQGVPVYVPPTRVIPTATPEPTFTPTSEIPPSTAGCQDGLTFINDETIPDGTVVQAGASIDKRWEVQNSGTCNWGEGYTIRLIGGSDMGVTETLDIFPARSNTNVSIRIQFQAPAEAGSYRSAWQAFNPQGQAFGDPFYIDIVVEE